MSIDSDGNLIVKIEKKLFHLKSIQKEKKNKKINLLIIIMKGEVYMNFVREIN